MANARTRDGLGRPLDDKGKRFFALRDSGYKGGTDRDGYATDAHADIFAALDKATPEGKRKSS